MAIFYGEVVARKRVKQSKVISMSDFDELLSSDAAEEIFSPADGYETADYKDKNIISIVNKSISDMSEQISVAGETNSQYIFFQRDRYVDNIDLNDKLIQIHYERPDGVNDNSAPVNVEISDKHIRFGWVVPAKATAIDGILKVMPYAYGVSPTGDTYILKDLYVEYRIHEGLAMGEEIEEPDAQWYTQFLDKMRSFTNTAKQYADEAKDYMDQTKRLLDSLSVSFATVDQLNASISILENRIKALENRP